MEINSIQYCSKHFELHLVADLFIRTPSSLLKISCCSRCWCWNRWCGCTRSARPQGHCEAPGGAEVGRTVVHRVHGCRDRTALCQRVLRWQGCPQQPVRSRCLTRWVPWLQVSFSVAADVFPVAADVLFWCCHVCWVERDSVYFAFKLPSVATFVGLICMIKVNVQYYSLQDKDLS